MDRGGSGKEDGREAMHHSYSHYVVQHSDNVPVLQKYLPNIILCCKEESGRYLEGGREGGERREWKRGWEGGYASQLLTLCSAAL